MIRTDSQPAKFQAQFTNGVQVSVSDTTPDKGGGNLGFRPHELLEARTGQLHEHDSPHGCGKTCHSAVRRVGERLAPSH